MPTVRGHLVLGAVGARRAHVEEDAGAGSDRPARRPDRPMSRSARSSLDHVLHPQRPPWPADIQRLHPLRCTVSPCVVRRPSSPSRASCAPGRGPGARRLGRARSRPRAGRCRPARPTSRSTRAATRPRPGCAERAARSAIVVSVRPAGGRWGEPAGDLRRGRRAIDPAGRGRRPGPRRRGLAPGRAHAHACRVRGVARRQAVYVVRTRDKRVERGHAGAASRTLSSDRQKVGRPELGDRRRRRRGGHLALGHRHRRPASAATSARSSTSERHAGRLVDERPARLSRSPPAPSVRRPAGRRRARAGTPCLVAVRPARRPQHRRSRQPRAPGDGFGAERELPFRTVGDVSADLAVARRRPRGGRQHRQRAARSTGGAATSAPTLALAGCPSSGSSEPHRRRRPGPAAVAVNATGDALSALDRPRGGRPRAASIAAGLGVGAPAPLLGPRAIRHRRGARGRRRRAPRRDGLGLRRRAWWRPPRGIGRRRSPPGEAISGTRRARHRPRPPWRWTPPAPRSSSGHGSSRGAGRRARDGTPLTPRAGVSASLTSSTADGGPRRSGATRRSPSFRQCAYPLDGPSCRHRDRGGPVSTVKPPDIDLGQYKFGWHDPANYVFEPKRGLNADVVREISFLKGEPEWMLKFRLRALEIFERKPMPTWGGGHGRASTSRTSSTSSARRRSRAPTGTTSRRTSRTRSTAWASPRPSRSTSRA